MLASAATTHRSAAALALAAVAPWGWASGGAAPSGVVVRHLAALSAGLRRRLAPRAAEVAMEPAGWEHASTSGATDPVVDALRAGDEAAFLALVNRYHASMIRVATLYVGSRSIAEEVAQEAWIGVLNGVRRFEGRSSLKTWIFRILANCAKARGAREVRSVPLSSLGDPDDEGPTVPADRFMQEGLWAGHWSQPPAAWTDDRVGAAELVALIREGIATLPPAQQRVMTLRDVEGWESEEVCELMEISEANQRVLLHRARAKVRAFVEERTGKEDRR